MTLKHQLFASHPRPSDHTEIRPKEQRRPSGTHSTPAISAMFALTRSLSKRFTKGLDNVFYRPNKTAKKESKEVEVEKQMTRCKPDGLEALCHSTKFTRKELQIMYRGFKNECPSGMVNEETFKYIYSQFFPQGDCTAYAHFVFNTFDQDHSGTISFEEFVMGLSLLLRGSLLEKLQWVFSLYDVNHDGVITADELHMVVSAVYDVMGKFCNPKIGEDSINEHVQALFQKLDVDRDGVISFDEFINTCYNDKMITNSIAVFDTVF